jgi:hypothetical protein
LCGAEIKKVAGNSFHVNVGVGNVKPIKPAKKKPNI